MKTVEEIIEYLELELAEAYDLQVFKVCQHLAVVTAEILVFHRQIHHAQAVAFQLFCLIADVAAEYFAGIAGGKDHSTLVR